jgi:hypothetical protein
MAAFESRIEKACTACVLKQQYSAKNDANSREKIIVFIEDKSNVNTSRKADFGEAMYSLFSEEDA